MCYLDFDVKWHTKISGPVYSTGMLLDMNGDGRRELVVTPYNAFVELLYASSPSEDSDVYQTAVGGMGGSRVLGWPATLPGAIVGMSSPLARDANGDGEAELLVISQIGQIIHIDKDGVPLLGHTVKLPPLRVRSDWYYHGGSREHDPDIAFSLYRHAEKEANEGSGPLMHARRRTDVKSHDDGTQSLSEALKILEQDPDWRGDPSDDDDDDTTTAGDDTVSRDDDMDDIQQGPSHRRVAPDVHKVFAGVSGGLTDEGLASLALFLPSDVAHGAAHNLTATGHRIRHGHNALRAPLYDAWVQRTEQQRLNDKTHVWLEAHVIADAVLRDLDGDGRDELIVPVSYFFDSSTLNDPERRSHLPPGINPRMYAACGVDVLDAFTGALLMRVPLDLTSKRSDYAAMITAAPVVADVDLDGSLDIVVATGAGFLYVMNRHGKVFDGYPLSLASLHTTPLVADFDRDGDVEIAVCDDMGVLSVFRGVGATLVWEQQVSGSPNAAPVAADIDGNGKTDIVLAGGDQLIWAFNAADGSKLTHFPVRVPGRVAAELTLAALSEIDVCEAPTILAGADDGFLYAINGKSGCVDAVDLGGGLLGAPLIDDLDGDGRLDIVAVTERGDVYCLGTQALYHPLKTEWRGRAVYRHNTRGIYALRDRNTVRHVSGSHFRLTFEIVDNGPRAIHSTYDVTLRVGFSNTPLLRQTFDAPGVYSVDVDTPLFANTVTFSLSMEDAVGVIYEDIFTMAFNVHAYRLVKHLVAVPFLASVAVLLLSILLADSDDKDLLTMRI